LRRDQERIMVDIEKAINQREDINVKFLYYWGGSVHRYKKYTVFLFLLLIHSFHQHFRQATLGRRASSRTPPPRAAQYRHMYKIPS
jgi:uncharacterized protein YfbU (UPF0304 family)